MCGYSPVCTLFVCVGICSQVGMAPWSVAGHVTFGNAMHAPGALRVCIADRMPQPRIAQRPGVCIAWIEG